MCLDGGTLLWAKFGIHGIGDGGVCVKVEEVTVDWAGDQIEVTGRMTSPSWSGPRTSWFRVPESFAGTPALSAADPWIAALLLPAMRAREPLEVAAPASDDLLAALPQLQTIYADWMPSTAPVEVKAEGRRTGPTREDGAALFFSCGVDSWYSLLKAQDRSAIGRRSPLTHLVHVHGVDIDVGEWKADVADEVSVNTRRIATAFDLTPVPVATNLRRFYSRLGLSWHWAQAGALSAIALLLSDDFGQFVTAAGALTSAVATNPAREAGGCHPLLMPLFSTARCEMVIDGGEADRLHKLRRVSRESLAMQTLRVCWASHEPAYNCGRCAKCVRTLLELRAVDALGDCTTLPDRLDPEVLAEVAALFPHEGPILEDRYERLVAQGADPDVLAALEAGIARTDRAAAKRRRALDKIVEVLAPDVPVAVLDEDEIRYDLARTHATAVPFPERDGFFNGLPGDDADAVEELSRLRRSPVVALIVWAHDFWALDYYPAFTKVLETECELLAATPEVRIYRL
jgi:hypothetical protein